MHILGESTVNMMRCNRDLCTNIVVVLSNSSNDAFTNQHSLIPPSFGGPHINVALPRVADAAASETVSTVSETSTTPTVVSSELVAEVGHDVVKDLMADGVNYELPDELMSAAERSSISAAGAGFDAALRRSSSAEPAEMCSRQQCVDMKYTDDISAAAVESSDALHNGHAACNVAWQLLSPGLDKIASDSSIASSVGSMLEGSSMDISGLVCRTAAVAGHSSFKTHALTERTSPVDAAAYNVDGTTLSVTDKTEMHDDSDHETSPQHLSSELGIDEHSVKHHDDEVAQQRCVK